MKKILFPTVIFIAFSLFFTSCDSPITYHDNIIENYNNIDSMIVIFVQNVYDKEASVEDLQNNYDEAKQMHKSNIEKLSKIKEISDDPGLYTAVVEFNDTCNSLLNNEFRSVIDIYSSGDWTDKKGDQVDGLMEEIYNKIVKMEDKVIEFEKLFAQKNNITLPEDE